MWDVAAVSFLHNWRRDDDLLPIRVYAIGSDRQRCDISIFVPVLDEAGWIMGSVEAHAGWFSVDHDVEDVARADDADPVVFEV